MQEITRFYKQNVIVWLLCWTLVVISGCATHNAMPIFAHTSSAPPPLSGKTIAVLPPAIVGSELKIAIDAAQAIDTVFSGDIAGARFTSGNLHLQQMQRQPEGINILYRQMASGLPAYFMPVKDEAPELTDTMPEKDAKKTAVYVKGKAKIILDGDTVAGQKRDGSYNVTINLASSAAALAPDRLDPVLLKSFHTDYVLTSVPFGDYVKTKRILALFGIIPLGGGGAMWSSPRGLFALYESQSGQKVWEGQIGTEATNQSELMKGQLPSVTHIVVGAAYLLTGDAETSLARILSTTAPLQK